MINAYKKILIKSLLTKGGMRKLINLGRHFLTYPRSKYVITGGINIIHRCNLDCKFCSYRFSNHKVRMTDMDEKTFERLLKIEALKHVLILNLGSGEPLLHKDLFKFIKEAQNMGKYISIASNGTLIGGRLKELLKNPPNFMWVSHYDKYKTLQRKNIKLLLKNKPKDMIFGISKLIGRNNLKDMEKIFKFASELKIRNIWFQQFVPRPTFKGEEFILKQIIFDNDTKSLAFIAKTKKLQRKKYKNINCTYPHPVPRNPTTYFCPFLYKGFNLEPNGAIQPCCFIHPQGKATYGNIFKNKWVHLNNKKYLALKKSFINRKNLKPICKYCYALNLR